MIADIGVSISPKQAFDLDFMSKGLPDKSKDLQICIKRGWIKVLKSDRKKKRKKPEKVVYQHQMDKSIIGDMQKILREEIQKQLAAIQTKQVVPVQEENTKINQVLAILTKLLEQGNTLTPDVIKEAISRNQEDISIDEDTLMEIHARAVNRIAQDTDGAVINKDEQISSLDIAEHVSELEDLIE